MDDRVDLVYGVLDEQIVDVDGRRCGRVDDVELVGGPGGPLQVAGLLSGPGAYPDRLPRRLRGVACRLFGSDVRGSRVRRIPWQQVEEVASRVTLRGRAEDLGLGTPDLALGRWFDRLPGA
jgi:sporulation protein YlmC with PRC-barrel domain